MGALDNLIKKTKDSVENVIEAEEVIEAQKEEDAKPVDGSKSFVLDKPVTAHVTCDVLNVRADASSKNPRIGQLKHGEAITVEAVCHSWLRIQYNNGKAFVFAKYTDFKDHVMTVTASVLNVRKGGGTNFDKIGSLKKGTVVKVLDEEKGWVKISYNNREGYVSKEYLA